MAARKINGWWYVDFYVGSKRYRERSPQNTAPGARAYENYLRGEIAKMGSLDHLKPQEQEEKQAVPTFAEFAERWMRDYVVVNNKPSEQRAKRFALQLHLLPAVGDLRIDTITSKHVEHLKGILTKKKICPKSINNYLSILRKCLSTAVDWEEMSDVPRIKPLKCAPPLFRFLTEEEVKALLDAAERGSMLYALILTGVRTGLRSCELLALRWEDVDLTTRQLCVRRSIVRDHLGTTKTYEIRYIPLVREVIEVLVQLPRSGPLVFHRDGQRIRYERGAERLRDVCRTAGVSPLGWHVLRHTFASHLAQRGVPLQFIQKLLGHSSIKMTERYAHLQPTNLQQAISVLEGLSQVWAVYGQQPHERGVSSTEPVVSSAPVPALNDAKNAT